MMTRRVTRMSWFEEWFMFLEIIQGKSRLRWDDVEMKYLVDNKTARRVFDAKLAMILKAWRSWPCYVTIEEDEQLRNEK